MDIWVKVYNHYKYKLFDGRMSIFEQVQLCTSLLHYVCIHGLLVRDVVKEFEEEYTKLTSTCSKDKTVKCVEFLEVILENWKQLMDVNKSVLEYILDVVGTLHGRHRYIDRDHSNYGVSIALFTHNFQEYTMTTLSKGRPLSVVQTLHLLVPLLVEMQQFYLANYSIKAGLNVAMRMMKHQVHKHKDVSVVKDLRPVLEALAQTEQTSLFQTADDLLQYIYASESVRILNFFEVMNK